MSKRRKVSISSNDKSKKEESLTQHSNDNDIRTFKIWLFDYERIQDENG
jgi:hypothetical protein